MKQLNMKALQQVSGGVLCIDGICKIVPTIGVPAQYYATLDNAYNQYLNDQINDDQLDQKLIFVPWEFEEHYIGNMLSVFC